AGAGSTDLLALPLVANGWGPWAFLTAAQTLVLLCVGQAAVAWIALMRAGAASRRAAGIAVRLLWPFNAQRAAQLVNEQIAAGAPATVAARALLGDEGYLHAMRPAVFDAIAGAGSTDLLALYSRAELTSFLDRPIQSDGEPFCPRCGTIYRAGITQCADCDGVSLRPAIRT
ncbi:MAG TPA: hypothetical protein VJ867_02485, partial [Gemmatimonadaceae bacterium]|nr:hypothetical protein [Gemmatimonadaceae bacterium]